MIVSFAVAMDENRVIGVENRLPWHIPEDLKHFKRVTSGHPVIMGRKTYESIGRLLPGRTNIILTRQNNLAIDGAVVVKSLDEAWEAAGGAPGADEVFVIGGGEIFSLAMERVDRMHITEVHTQIRGDAFFPEFSRNIFQEVSRVRHNGTPDFSFVVWERKSSLRNNSPAR